MPANELALRIGSVEVHCATAGVSPPIIDLLEVVHIEQPHGERPIRSIAAIAFAVSGDVGASVIRFTTYDPELNAIEMHWTNMNIAVNVESDFASAILRLRGRVRERDQDRLRRGPQRCERRHARRRHSHVRAFGNFAGHCVGCSMIRGRPS